MKPQDIKDRKYRSQINEKIYLACGLEELILLKYPD